MAKQRPAKPRNGGGNGNGSNGGAKRGGNTGQPTRRSPRAGASRRAGRKGGGSTGTVNTFSGQTQTISGYDYITNIVAPYSLSETSSRLIDIPMTPTALAGTRWSQLATMFEKYRFMSCQMCYVPAVASVVGGQVISYWELDPTDPFGASGNLNQDLRVAMAHQNAKLHNVYDNTSVSMPLRTGIADFFVEKSGGGLDNPRWTRQATYRVIASAGLTGFLNKDVTSMVIGSLYMKWVCLFKNPQIQPSLIVPISTIQAPLKPAATDVLANVFTPAKNTVASGVVNKNSWFDQDGQPLLVDNYSRVPGNLTPGTYKYNALVATAQGLEVSYTREQYATRVKDAIYVIRGAPLPADVIVVYSKQQPVWVGPEGSTSPSVVGCMELTLERFTNGHIALFHSLGTAGSIGVVRDVAEPAVSPSPSDYGIPALLVKVAAGFNYIYGFFQENAETIAGAYNIVKDVAELIASVADAREITADYPSMLSEGLKSGMFVATPTGFAYSDSNPYRCCVHDSMMHVVNIPFANIDDEPQTPEQ